nr:hypothetical protein 1573p1_00035 [Serratia marcescens]
MAYEDEIVVASNHDPIADWFVTPRLLITYCVLSALLALIYSAFLLLLSAFLVFWVRRTCACPLRGLRVNHAKNHAKRCQKSILIRFSLKMTKIRYLQPIFCPICEVSNIMIFQTVSSLTWFFTPLDFKPL